MTLINKKHGVDYKFETQNVMTVFVERSVLKVPWYFLGAANSGLGRMGVRKSRQVCLKL